MTTSPVASIGGYTLLARIGEGGMGIVHLARRPGGERVALKLLRPHIVGDDEARHRLAREVSSLWRIRSDKVAGIIDADPWAPVPYVATRYVPGLSLHDHVHEEGPVAGRDLAHLAASLAEGVAAVHAAGVLHRDVKPANVLMEGRTPILIDFGLARVADDPRLTHTGWLLGTPGYLAPEILHGDDATTASDVHSWAATVAWAATGRAPFGRGPSMAIMDRVRRGEHDLDGVPGALRTLLAEALEPEPWRRPTLEQVEHRLRTLGPDLDAAPEPRPVPWAPPGPPATRTQVLTAVRPPRTAVPASPPAPTPPTAGRAPDPWPDTSADTSTGTSAGTDADTEDRMPPVLAPWDLAEPRASLGERARRAVVLLLLAALVGLAAAAAPWLTLLVVVLVTWLLRSGSLAGSAAGDRRRLRGRRFYDGPLVLLRAPWDLVRSVPGTTALVAWSSGLAVAAALLAYAAHTSLTTGLGVMGTALALGLWSGPGSSRVRSPLRRAARPLARGPVGFVLALLVLAGAGAGLALAVQDGTSWAPAQDRPLSGGLPGLADLLP